MRSIHDFKKPALISPEEFERNVKLWFEAAAGTLEDFSAQHRELVGGMDGEFEVDVSLRFRALGGASFLVLVECKKQKARVKRAVVQVLREQLLSVGGHKGFIVSTAGFQKGAVQYAEKHGISLMQLSNGSLAYIRASAVQNDAPRFPDGADDLGLHFYTTERGHRGMSAINEDRPLALRDLLGLP
jgi:restriction system protein